MIFLFLLLTLWYSRLAGHQVERAIEDVSSLNSTGRMLNGVDSKNAKLSPWSSSKNGPARRQDFSVLPTLMNAKKLSNTLEKFASKELGADVLNSIIGKLYAQQSDHDMSVLVNEIAANILKKIQNIDDVLENSCSAVTRIARRAPHDSALFKQYHECCSLSMETLKYDIGFHAHVNMSLSCDIVPHTINAFSFHPTRNLTSVFERNLVSYKSLKWQYFISSDGLNVEYPSHNFDVTNYTNCLLMSRHRHADLYLSTVLPHPKAVVILIDFGSLIADNQIITAKAIAKSLLAALSERDKVSILGIGRHVLVPPRVANCANGTLVPVSAETKKHFLRFIDTFMDAVDVMVHKDCPSDSDSICSRTNHSLGFVKAFNVLSSSNDYAAKYVLYISRGLLSSIEEAGLVTNVIARENLKMKNLVLINTFAVLDSNKQIMLETKFLESVAQQNVTKYANTDPLLKVSMLKADRMPPKGKILIMNSSVRSPALTLDQLRSTFEHPHFSMQSEKLNLEHENDSTAFDASESEQEAKLHFSQPYWDMSGRGMILSISRVVQDQKRPIGVVGADLHLSDLVDGITYFAGPVEDEVYAFLVETNGRVVMHPKLPRPLNWRSGMGDIRIGTLETAPNFITAYRLILSQSEGSYSDQSEPEQGGGVDLRRIYTWKHITGTPFIAVLSSRPGRTNSVFLRDDKVITSSDVTHHRIDLVLKENVCLHFNQLASMQYASYFLSARCFEEPFTHLGYSESEELRRAQSQYLFMHDQTRLVSVRGFKHGVRRAVGEFSRIAQVWKDRAFHSPYSPYILRRYLASVTGVMMVYPATVIDQTYDPASRDWYRRAVTYPNQTVFTGPTLDPSGAGYMVSISRGLVENEDNPDSKVVAVVSMDVPLGFVYKLLRETVKLCQSHGTRCFLFEDFGYVVGHPKSDFEPSGNAPIERHHLTHKERLVTNDILREQSVQFVRKRICNRYSDHTSQRYYQFNTSYDRVVRWNGDEKLKRAQYQITRIKNTNVFLAIVNETSEKGIQYCWCSHNDRLCINCATTDTADCDCPCECPLAFPRCEAVETSEFFTSIVPACDRQQDPLNFQFMQTRFLAKFRTLPLCLPPACASHTSESACLGLVGCEWCAFEMDGATGLKAPFCGSVNKCFGGVRGQSPYAERAVGSAAGDDLAASTPVGPVAGGILALFVVLVAGVVCCRRQVLAHLAAHGPGVYGGSSTDSGMRLNAPEGSDDFDEEIVPFDDGPPGNQMLSLASFERSNIHSLSGLNRPPPRRGPGTESSDHGYSTMTPNAEDSERGTTIEPLVSHDRQLPKPFQRTSLGKLLVAGSNHCQTAKLLSSDAAASTDLNNPFHRLSLQTVTLDPDKKFTGVNKSTTLPPLSSAGPRALIESENFGQPAKIITGLPPTCRGTGAVDFNSSDPPSLIGGNVKLRNGGMVDLGGYNIGDNGNAKFPPNPYSSLLQPKVCNNMNDNNRLSGDSGGTPSIIASSCGGYPGGGSDICEPPPGQTSLLPSSNNEGMSGQIVTEAVIHSHPLVEPT